MARLPATPTCPSIGPWLTIGLCCPDGSSLTTASSETLDPLPATYEFAAESAAPREIGLRWESRGSQFTPLDVLACCLPYPGPTRRVRLHCFFLFGISLHPWCHGFCAALEVLRLESSKLIPKSTGIVTARELASPPFEDVYIRACAMRSPSISVEYDYVDKQSIPTAGLSPASPTALWAAGHRIPPYPII